MIEHFLCFLKLGLINSNDKIGLQLAERDCHSPSNSRIWQIDWLSVDSQQLTDFSKSLIDWEWVSLTQQQPNLVNRLAEHDQHSPSSSWTLYRLDAFSSFWSCSRASATSWAGEGLWESKPSTLSRYRTARCVWSFSFCRGDRYNTCNMHIYTPSYTHVINGWMN